MSYKLLLTAVGLIAVLSSCSEQSSEVDRHFAQLQANSNCGASWNRLCELVSTGDESEKLQAMRAMVLVVEKDPTNKYNAIKRFFEALDDESGFVRRVAAESIQMLVEEEDSMLIPAILSHMKSSIGSDVFFFMNIAIRKIGASTCEHVDEIVSILNCPISIESKQTLLLTLEAISEHCPQKIFPYLYQAQHSSNKRIAAFAEPIVRRVSKRVTAISQFTSATATSAADKSATAPSP